MRLDFQNITSLSRQEKLTILSWRNSDKVRVNMVNQKIITEENHLAYCEKLSKDNSTILFRVSISDTPCGVVNFTNLDYKTKTGEYGLYVVDPRPGLGIYIGRIALFYFFNVLSFSKLNIIVFESNKNALMFNEKILFFKNPEIYKNEFNIEGQSINAVHYSMDKDYWENAVKQKFSTTFASVDFYIDGKRLKQNLT